jgi:hypothetical protein
MQWWPEYFGDVDTMQSEKYGRWFADNIDLQFNSEPVIEGKAAVLAFLLEFTKSFKQIEHSHGALVAEGNHAAGEAVITFTGTGDAKVAVRGVTMVTREHGLFRRMAIFADFSAVYAALAQAG